ncbi:hypothetical protein ACKWTF_010744 [Chironomus riparius]
MRVRSPLGYRSSYNLDDKPQFSSPSNNLNVTTSKPTTVQLSSANIKSVPRSTPPIEEPTRKTSILSFKSLSLSLSMFKGSRARASEGHIESQHLKTIDEPRKSIFKMDIFEKNLKKFISKSTEPEFQSYSEYTQQMQENVKPRRNTIFKSQKIYARRSSMSDIPDMAAAGHRVVHMDHGNAPSHSQTNLKHEQPKKYEYVKYEHKTQKSHDKTAEMLKEVRKRNLETAKRINAPRRISTAY